MAGAESEHRIITSASELASVFRNDQFGVFTVKPRLLFGAVERRFGRPVPMCLPVPSSQIGSVTLLEAALLVSLIKLTSPQVIFEFGTFLGYTTSVFVANSDPSAAVVSVDLPADSPALRGSIDEQQVLSDFKVNDAYLSQVQHEQGTPYLEGAQRQRVRLIKKDSRELHSELEEYLGQCGIIFIDGGHALDVAAQDTSNAMRLMSPRSVIAWHDVGSQLHTEVTDVVNQVALTHTILRVESTMLALYLTEEVRDALVS